MVGSSYDQKPYRRSMMQTWGATVHRSPSDRTESGRAQAAHPTGSLGIAISEAVEVAAQDPDTNYALGSVLNHVLLHQTVIGQEAIEQLELADAFPDVVVGCVGGGSNFAGIAFPFMRGMLRGENQIRFVAAEPAACPTLTRGVYRYDFGDTVGLTPLMPMYTLGHDFVPPPVHAGGLRYHGDAPMLCGLVKAGVVEARAYRQNETFEAAVRFARTEGIIPAPEPAHAIRAVIEEAEAAKRGGRGAHDPVRPLRPRQLRPRRLRRLPRRHARGPGVLRGRHGGGARTLPEGTPGDRLEQEAAVRRSARPPTCAPPGGRAGRRRPSAEAGGDAGAAEGPGDLDAVGEVGDQRHPRPTPGCRRAGACPSPSSATVTSTPSSSRLADTWTSPGRPGRGRRAHGVRHGLRHDDADGVAVDGDPAERLQHRSARTRRALGLGRQIDVEQGGLHNLAHTEGMPGPDGFTPVVKS